MMPQHVDTYMYMSRGEKPSSQLSPHVERVTMKSQTSNRLVVALVGSYRMFGKGSQKRCLHRGNRSQATKGFLTAARTLKLSRTGDSSNDQTCLNSAIQDLNSQANSACSASAPSSSAMVACIRGHGEDA